MYLLHQAPIWWPGLAMGLAMFALVIALIWATVALTGVVRRHVRLAPRKEVPAP